MKIIIIIISVIITVVTAVTKRGNIKRKTTREIVLLKPELSQFN
jgi:hypothetical protein